MGQLTQFGAFSEDLPLGSRASHHHWHVSADEMALILEGTSVLTENGIQTVLQPGDAAC